MLSNSSSHSGQYVLATGANAVGRLDVLHQIYSPMGRQTLLEAGLAEGMTVADFGCGTGTMTRALASMVGPSGSVTGIDMHAAQLEQAREACAREGGRIRDSLKPTHARQDSTANTFDLVYCRFLLLHLSNPASCLSEMRRVLKPGGILVVEDGDLASAASVPTTALDAFADLFSRLGPLRGVDYSIANRLCHLVADAGFSEIGLNVHQPAESAGASGLLLQWSVQEAGPAFIEAGLITAINWSEPFGRWRTRWRIPTSWRSRRACLWSGDENVIAVNSPRCRDETNYLFESWRRSGSDRHHSRVPGRAPRTARRESDAERPGADHRIVEIRFRAGRPHMRRRTFLALPVAPAFARQTRTPRELAADHHRPVYHYLPPANWMNDPNAPIYWKGRYHIFYQYNPNGAYWGSMHWGHAASLDMIHWRNMGTALAPQPGSYDHDGVFSGCCVVNNGVPTIVYTGTDPEVQCVATSHSDDLRAWRRAEQNPVIAHPPEGLEVTGFRDPCVWQEDGAWYMALGSGIKGVGGCVLLYKSPDLLEWTYVQPLFEGKMDPNVKARGPVASGEMWECPSFFPLGGKHVLIVSTRDTTPWYVGSYRDNKFTPETEGRLDTGDYYAPITQLDSQGRRIVWGWIQEHRSGEAQRAAGWSGVLSLPRQLRIRDDGTLGITPAPQVRSLFGAQQNYANLFIPDGRPMLIPGVEGDAIRIRAEIEVDDADECGLLVLCSDDLAEHTPVVYNDKLKRLAIGHRPSTEQSGNLELKDGELLRLNIYIDASVIEVFANGRACVTGRSYTARADSTGVALTARGGTAKVRSLTVYEMKAISTDRLTT